MLRKAISNQLKFILKTTEELEQQRAKEYGHQVALNDDERAGYNNLTNIVMHWEGRAKEARSILRMIDDLEVPVIADKCGHCGHHEIGVGIVDKFRALKPGELILVRHIN